MYVKHNLSKTPEYRCWQQIKARCLNPNHRMYPHYGGRGITIAAEWEKDFLAFLSHVGERPTKKHSLDRVDNTQGYRPGNVRWASWEEQANNRRPYGRSNVKLREADSERTTNFKHGLIHLPEYNIWSAVKDRCLNPRSANYPYYGGRGITIYQPWVVDFPAFLAYVGSRPSKLYSLDRIDNDGNYEPGNLRWSTAKEQRANQRSYPSGSDHGNHKHGGTGEGPKGKRQITPEYRAWVGIKTRCFNPNSDGYDRYGGVGITMCQGWRDSFEAFLQNLGAKPTRTHKLARKDLEGPFSCGACSECQAQGWVLNCRWATQAEVNRSRRSSERSGKLDEAKVKEIRQLLAQKVPYKDVAHRFGICLSLVGKIKRREAWA